MQSRWLVYPRLHKQRNGYLKYSSIARIAKHAHMARSWRESCLLAHVASARQLASWQSVSFRVSVVVILEVLRSGLARPANCPTLHGAASRCPAAIDKTRRSDHYNTQNHQQIPLSLTIATLFHNPNGVGRQHRMATGRRPPPTPPNLNF